MEHKISGELYHKLQILMTYNSNHIGGNSLNEEFIKQLHFILKSGTEFEINNWIKIGDYKTKLNMVGDIDIRPKKRCHRY